MLLLRKSRLHSKYGGVVPEIASRKHIEAINPVIEQALNDADVTLREIEGIAVTRGPGLIGSLLIGLSTAKALAYALDIPFVGCESSGRAYCRCISCRKSAVNFLLQLWLFPVGILIFIW